MNQYATYCPEDNKLRLYVGRVPRDEYEKLRAEGWTSTPKQDCNFVAVWTPQRRDTALHYGEGVILDEDMGPADRAADRAERFGGYLDKRLDEATGHADRFDAGPAVHGFQNAARAERAAARHDRVAGRAVDAWDKAEYWQRRTAGVISHALHVSTPSVRMGRIKDLEADIRKAEKSREEYRQHYERWVQCAAMADGPEKNETAEYLAGSGAGVYDYKHPRPEEVTNAHIREKGTSLWTLLNLEQNEYGKSITASEACELWFARHDALGEEGDWLQHLRLRLAYENQMLEAQGGRAGALEIEVGGWVRASRRGYEGEWFQVSKVNKSTVTGRVVSVEVRGYRHEIKGDGHEKVLGLFRVGVERMDPKNYRPPTDEERTAFAETVKKEKAEAKASKPPVPPLVNPTDADAERLQQIWNAASGDRPMEVLHVTQEVYAANSKGTFGRMHTVTVNEHGTPSSAYYMGSDLRNRCEVFKVRSTTSGRVIVLTDKPKKPIPFDAVASARAAQPTVESMAPRLPEIAEELTKDWLGTRNRSLLNDAAYVGWVSIRSLSQIYWTDAGAEAYRKHKESLVTV
jgi:hypothetical protein